MGNKVKPTDKQKAFVRAKIENPGISNYEAAIKANYSPNTAKNAGEAIVEKCGVQMFLEKLADDDVIAKKLNEGLEANKVISARTMGNADEKTDDFIEVPDFPTRLNYLKEFLGLKGYKQEGGNNYFDNRSQTINVVPNIKELKGFLKWRDEQRRARLSKSTDSSPK